MKKSVILMSASAVVMMISSLGFGSDRSDGLADRYVCSGEIRDYDSGKPMGRSLEFTVAVDQASVHATTSWAGVTALEGRAEVTENVHGEARSNLARIRYSSFDKMIFVDGLKLVALSEDQMATVYFFKTSGNGSAHMEGPGAEQFALVECK